MIEEMIVHPKEVVTAMGIAYNTRLWSLGGVCDLLPLRLGAILVSN